MGRGRLPILSAALVCGCSLKPDSLPPYGEVVVHVDTDLPAPLLASRIRIDFFDHRGRWFESRDVARPNEDDWPLSFGVWVGEPEARDVWIRLRVYPQGKVRSYSGERFQDWPEVLSGPTADGTGPRLVLGETDRTPATEPEPLVTVDRLVLVPIPNEQKRHLALVLHGACAGTMVRLGHQPAAGPVRGEASSCVDAERERALVAPEPLVDEPPAERPMRGTWALDPCEEQGAGSRVCVAGGAMVLGNRNLLMADFIDAAPERVVAISRFDMDRREVSVGDFRAALREGFAPARPPIIHDGPLTGDEAGSCAYTSTAADREEFPLNCVSWDTARAYCRARGGDLPTEAQWEFAATIAGRSTKVSFPWGEDDPTCESVVFGRARLGGADGFCQARGLGPLPFGIDDLVDVSPLGISGLAGRISEWTRDGGAPYSDPCWADAVVDPRCDPADTTLRSVRGGSWASPMPTLIGTFRLTRDAERESATVGFRCVREREP